ncbi:M12 family metallo-peptidase [Luminiphilus sp.]|nr:M12 family metallo-peptidase [Luminiphilus sp.]
MNKPTKSGYRVLSFVIYTVLFASTFMTIGSGAAQASESLWTAPVVAASRAQLAERTNELPEDFRPIEADLAGFKYLLTAHNRGEAYPLRVALPLPDGGFQYFLLEPSTLTPELFEESDPDFLLFKGVAEDDSSTRVQFEYSTSFGITARVLDQDGRWFVGPMGGSQAELSISYYLRDTGGAPERQCGVMGEAMDNSRPVADELKRADSASRNSGDIRHTYRIAIFTAENYDNFIYDSNKADNEETQVYQAVGITLARATDIYETELSITFTNNETDQRSLISSTDNKSGGGPTLVNTTAAINGVIGENSYDVGHLFAGSFAGVAGLGVVCSSLKGAGNTGLSNPVGDPFDVDYFSHELGHQFGGQHPHTGAECNAYWGVEPGSGSTIMGYAGVCNPNVQRNSDPYFHSVNFSEMRAFVESGGGDSCAVKPATGNAIPVVNAGADYTIPHSTSFMLTGSASDSDNNSLTYSWEQIDSNAALFRVRNPSSSPSRYFPKLGQTSGFPETLPNGAATLNFRLTARDGIGGRAWDDMQVAVSASGSDFGLTAVNSNGASANVFWKVDGTNQAPISATEVIFYLSTDSGASYPYEISSTTNDGQATINFPGGIQTTTARLMVKGKDNIFFSTSTQDFSVDSVTSSVPSMPTILNVDVDEGEIWLYVAPTNSAPVTTYEASCSDGATSYAGSSAQSPVTLTGLTSGVSYTCSVVAQNGAGQSSASNWPGAIIPEQSPQGLPVWLLYEVTKQHLQP